MDYQENYFRKTKTIEKEILCVEKMNYAYNELFQMWVEKGLLSLLTYIVVL